MILNDEEVAGRLTSPENLLNKLDTAPPARTVEVLPVSHGNRGEGSINIPNPVRELLGRLANISGETKSSIANTFNVDNRLVGDYSRGLITNRLDNDLLEEINKARNEKLTKAHDDALDLMVNSMAHLKDRLGEVKAKELSRIAKDMHSIATNNGNADKGGTVNNTQVILYAPRHKSEREYETLEA